MASQVTQIDEIIAGRVDWKIKVRLTNLWSLPSKNNPQETNQLEMLLLDEKRGRILAFIPKSWVTRFQPMLKEGSTYLLEELCVCGNDTKFKRTDHKYKLSFLGTTRVTLIDAPEIPINSFHFTPFPAVVQEHRSDLYLDVIGHVAKKDTLKDKDYNGKPTVLLDIVLQDQEHNMVKCTLWEGFAHRMNQYLEKNDPSLPVVVILQQCRLTKYLGLMGITTAFFGTKMYINDDLPEMNEYTASLVAVAGDVKVSQPVTQIVGSSSLSLSDDLIQTRRMTISDLTEATQECMGSVLVSVIEIKMDQGWAYNSCNQCLKFVKLVDNKFHCCKCRCDVTATPRYKLHLQVIDDTGSTTFTLFNTLVSTYVGRSAEDLIRSYENRPMNGDTPVEFEPLLGKQFLFKVQVAEDINIRLGWQTYTVKKFTSDVSIIQRFIQLHKLKGCKPDDEEEFFDACCEVEDICPDVVLGLPAINTEVNPLAINCHANTSQPSEVSQLVVVSDSPVIPKVYGNPAFLSQALVGKEIEALFNDMDETPPTKSQGKRPVTHALLSAMDDTPPTKSHGKRSVAELDGLDLQSLDFSPDSASKLPKNLPNPTYKK